MVFVFLLLLYPIINKTHMKREIAIVCLIALATICELKAQEPGSRIRSWEQGRLTWEDFSRKTIQTGEKHARLKYFLTCEPERTKINDTSISRMEIKAFMDMDSSWVDPKWMTPAELRFQQMIFDMVELRSRLLQKETNRMRSSSEMDSCIEKGLEQIAEEIGNISKATGNGKDEAQMRILEEKLHREMEQADAESARIPEFKQCLFGFGADVGVGYHFLTSHLGENLKGGPNVQIGVNFALGRSELLLNACLGGSKVKRDSIFIGGEKWSASDHLEYCQLSASYGFRLLDRKHFQLTPFVGYGYNEFSTISGQNDEVKHKEKTGGFLGGVCLDYKLRTSLSFIPSYLKNKEMYTVSIRTKLYVTQTDFSDFPNGYILNCALMVKVFDRFIRLD